jgi:hypothetical protein
VPENRATCDGGDERGIQRTRMTVNTEDYTIKDNYFKRMRITRGITERRRRRRTATFRHEGDIKPPLLLKG